MICVGTALPCRVRYREGERVKRVRGGEGERGGGFVPGPFVEGFCGESIMVE